MLTTCANFAIFGSFGRQYDGDQQIASTAFWGVGLLRVFRCAYACWLFGLVCVIAVVDLDGFG